VLPSFLRRLTRGRDAGAATARGIGVTLGVNAAGSAASILASALIARAVGTDAYGVFAFVSSWVTVLALVGQAGFDTAAVRFVAEARARADDAGLARFVAWCRRRVAGFALLLAVPLAASSALAGWDARPALAAALLLGLAWLPLRAGQAQESAFLQGLKRVPLGRGLQWAARPFLGAALVALAWLLQGAHVGVGTAVIADCVAAAVTWLVAWAVVRGEVAVPATPAGAEERRAWLAVAWPLLVVAGGQVLLARSDVLMVGLLVGTREAGVYEVATRVSSLVPFVFHAGAAFLGPVVAELHAQGRRDELRRVVTGTSRACAVAATLAAAVLAVAATPALLVFGADFVAGRGALLVLLVGQVLASATGTATLVAVMSGGQRAASWVLGSSTVLNVALNALLIPRWGLEGAAWATFAALTLRGAALSWHVARSLGLDPTPLGLRLSVPGPPDPGSGPDGEPGDDGPNGSRR